MSGVVKLALVSAVLAAVLVVMTERPRSSEMPAPAASAPACTTWSWPDIPTACLADGGSLRTVRTIGRSASTATGPSGQTAVP